jgi:hypothetical protein
LKNILAEDFQSRIEFEMEAAFVGRDDLGAPQELPPSTSLTPPSEREANEIS